jgi:hypothetical protein
MADAARNIKFYFASPEHMLVGRGGRWPGNFFGSYRMSVEMELCCGRLTK